MFPTEYNQELLLESCMGERLLLPPFPFEIFNISSSNFINLKAFQHSEKRNDRLSLALLDCFAMNPPIPKTSL